MSVRDGSSYPLKGDPSLRWTMDRECSFCFTVRTTKGSEAHEVKHSETNEGRYGLGGSKGWVLLIWVVVLSGVIYRAIRVESCLSIGKKTSSADRVNIGYHDSPCIDANPLDDTNKR